MKPIGILNIGQRIDKFLEPLVKKLDALGITANHLTFIQFPFVILFFLSFLSRNLNFAIASLGITLFLDLLDGAFARITKTITEKGHFYDKILDLAGIYAFLGGIAVLFPQLLLLCAIIGILNAVIYLSNYYIKPELYFGVRSFGFVGLLLDKLYLALVLTLLVGVITLSYKIYNGIKNGKN